MRYARTLAVLVAHPGRLTQDYVAWRRSRYVLPLRLYLNASVLFVFAVRVLAPGETASSGADADADRAPSSAASAPSAMTSQAQGAARSAVRAEALPQAEQRCLDQPAACARWRSALARYHRKALGQSRHPAAAARRILLLAPYAVFVLLPVFAAIVMLAYRRRALPYSRHLVFSLHMHSVWILVLLALAALSSPAAVEGLVLLPVYAGWALYRVYVGRWWTALLRIALIAVLYGAALWMTIDGLEVVSVLAG